MSQCMDKYKESFALEFAKLMQENLPKWREIQEENKRKIFTSDILSSIMKSILASLLLGGALFYAIFKGGVLYFDIADIILNYSSIFVVILFVVVFVVFYTSAIFNRNKKFQNLMKEEIYPKLLKIYTPNIAYKKGDLDNSVYNATKLLDEDATIQERDDFFCGEYNGIKFGVNEIELETLHQSLTDSRRKDNITLFKGVALNFTLNKKINSHIHIYTKNSKKPPKGFEKVNLEYAKFNNKYDVYVQKTQMEAGGQVEARYLLTTSFMDRFIQLEMAFPVSRLRCSVKGAEMMILLSTENDLFEIGHIMNRIDDVSQYQNMFGEFASVFSFIDVLNLSSKTGL